MARYKFVRAVNIKDANGKNGQDFYPGTHDVPEVLEHSPMFLRHVELGSVLEAEAAPIAATTSAEKQKALVDKILAKKETPEHVKTIVGRMNTLPNDSQRTGIANGEHSAEEKAKLQAEKDEAEMKALEEEEKSEEKHGKTDKKKKH